MMHPETRACFQLLSAVVASAINDGCLTPPKKGVSGYQITTDSFTAMRFLFDKDQTGLDAYALWLDFETDQFRSRLLKIMKDDSALIIAGFDNIKRRNFRFNYNVWQKMSMKGDVFEDDENDSGSITYVEEYGELSSQFKGNASKSGGDSSDRPLGWDRRVVHRMVSPPKNTDRD